MSAIEVSVVMGVFNGQAQLATTLESVLAQQDCEFEFIVVDDGSTDATPRILDDWAARDARLRVIHQPNAGLTRALVRGCEAARGDFIARQDCGDVSLPGRLHRQAQQLRADLQAVMVACAARFVGPQGEPLFESARPGVELQNGLSILDVNHVKGPPHHGGTMFRRCAYEQAGGYRPFFVVAQDIDLWLRLAELGQCVGEAEVGYEARMEEGSISARRRGDQFGFAVLALECARRRRQGSGEGEVLSTPPERSALARPVGPRVERARFLYFIGSCLRASDPTAARRYFWRAFRAYPFSFKSLVRLALG